jgi:anti-sigma regulatory factor (Ser/Thr protein kinase)
MTDPVLLARIVGNLLSNAVRYTHDGRILLGVRRLKDGARIEVWDSGVGVAAEQLPHLFQEFYQVENPERDAAKGLGLGLSIVDRLAAALGYPVSVRSWPGQGSVFMVTVPRVPASAFVATDQARAEDLPAAKSVLLLMGNRDDAGRLASSMEDWGYQVLCPASPDTLQAAVGELPGVLICEDSQISVLDAALPREGEGLFDLVILGEETRSLRHGGLRRTEYLSNPPRPARLRALLQHLTSGDGNVED